MLGAYADSDDDESDVSEQAAQPSEANGNQSADIDSTLANFLAVSAAWFGFSVIAASLRCRSLVVSILGSLSLFISPLHSLSFSFLLLEKSVIEESLRACRGAEIGACRRLFDFLHCLFCRRLTPSQLLRRQLPQRLLPHLQHHLARSPRGQPRLPFLLLLQMEQTLPTHPGGIMILSVRWQEVSEHGPLYSAILKGVLDRDSP